MKGKLTLILIIIALSFYGQSLYKCFKLRCDYFNSSFNGNVSHLRLTEKKAVVFKTENDEHWRYLGFNVKYSMEIEVGDSLKKGFRDYNVFLVKDGITYNITSDRKIKYLTKYCKCE